MLANVARNLQMEEDEDDDDASDDEEFEFRPDVPFKRGSRYSVRVSSSLVCQYIARIIRHLKYFPTYMILLSCVSIQELVGKYVG
jgi:hypothetical protein